MNGMAVLQGKCPVLFDGFDEIYALRSGELDDWRYDAYTVYFAHSKLVMIEVFDEEGEFVAFWH